MIILLTGATGFIGGHVLGLLLEGRDTVVSFGRRTPAVALQHASRHRHIAGDLATGGGLDQVPWADIDQVIHLAAAGVKASRRVWQEALAVNVVGTQRLLECLYSAGSLPRVFVARTFYEEAVDQNPAILENSYVATKLAATQLTRLFARRYDGQVVFGRFFQVYGPGDDLGNVLTYAAREFRAGRSPFFGSGLSPRDWVYVSDAAAAVLACMRAHVDSGSEFDIGSGVLRTVRYMVELLHALCGPAPLPIFDASKDRADSNILQNARIFPPLWQPTIGPEKGLKTLLG